MRHDRDCDIRSMDSRCNRLQAQLGQARVQISVEQSRCETVNNQNVMLIRECQELQSQLELSLCTNRNRDRDRERHTESKSTDSGESFASQHNRRSTTSSSSAPSRATDGAGAGAGAVSGGGRANQQHINELRWSPLELGSQLSSLSVNQWVAIGTSEVNAVIADCEATMVS